jgi:hypothetical protein
VNTLRAIEQVTSAVRRDGVGLWPEFITGEPLRILQEHAAQLAAGEYALDFPKSTRVWDLYRHGEPFLDLLGQAHLSALVQELLGEHCILSDYSLNVVKPRQPVDSWHIDYPYNEMPHLVTGAMLGLQCIITLNDFTEANGATCCVIGSHLPPRRPAGYSQPDHATILEAVEGTLIVMAASTWHHSGYNASQQPRTGILMSFVERWIRPMVDPPEVGPWSRTSAMRLLLGQERPPETINGVPITGGQQ